MKINTYSLITIGIVLASLAYHFQSTIPLLSSVFAIIGAFLLIKAAKRLSKDKKKLKALRLKNKSSKNK